jgi:chromosomal replication initiator protein
VSETNTTGVAQTKPPPIPQGSIGHGRGSAADEIKKTLSGTGTQPAGTEEEAAEGEPTAGKAEAKATTIAGIEWPRVQTKLRTIVGEDVFQSWFARLEIEGFENGIVKVSVPTRFLKTWIQGHYMDALLEACRSEAADVNEISLSVRVPAGLVRQVSAEAGLGFKEEQLPQNGRLPAPGAGFRRQLGNGDAEGLAAGGDAAGGPFQGSPLDRRFTFETFVVGGSNRLAHAAAKQVAEMALTEPLRFNPLFIHSSVGLGKTHLLHAIAWEVRRKNPHAQVLYLTAERFRYRFVEALRSQDALSFKERLRGIDVLLVDDMEFLSGERTEQEFDATLNSLLDGGKQVVVASARAPMQLDSLDQRMRSRLAGGLVTELVPLDYDLRLKVLEKRAEEKRAADPEFNVTPEVIEFLAERLTESARELDGAITRLYAACHLTGQPITIETVEHIIRDLMRGIEPRRIKIEDILRVVSKHFGVSRSDILSQRRHRSIVWPRQIGMYLAKTLTQRSLPEIGRRFGGRDHTTVLHAIRKIDGELKDNGTLRAEIDDLKRLLSN